MDKAENLVRALRNLEVKDFNLKNPPSKLMDLIEVTDEKQNTIFKLSTSKAGAMVAVKTNLYSQVVGLDEAQIKGLGIDKLLQKEEQKEEAKK